MTVESDLQDAKDALISAKDLFEEFMATGITSPIGSIVAVPYESVPSGWYECDGQLLSRVTHANLFSLIGENFGEGDGSTTFNIPNLQGKFLRGWDNGAGEDLDADGRTEQATGGATGDHVGTEQADKIQEHNHGEAGKDLRENYDEFFAASGAANEASATVHISSSGDSNMLDVTDAYDKDPVRVGAETVPKNVAVMYIIKGDS
jgi:microcystin-dependent protein